MTKTVLVTGASGFIAAHVLKDFLDAGYHVRAAVRSEKSAAKVRQTHSKYGDALSFAIVPDMVAEGAFDDAVKGVDGVIHTASPFILNAKDFDKDLFQPALEGTLKVLRAAQQHGPGVKRIVITSSFAAVIDTSKGLRPGYTYTEADWNPLAPEDVKDPVNAYLVSKALAEKAAFDFVENEKPGFTINTLAPPMVYGPIAHAVDNLKGLNTSSAEIYHLIDGSQKDVPATGFWAYADVRDLSKAHLLAYETPLENQRYLITNSAYSFQQIVDIIHAKFSELKDATPVGNPGEPLPEVYKLDTSKVQTELGLKFRTLEETIVDTVLSLQELMKQLN